MIIPLKKVKNVNPTSMNHPINWHFDKPIGPIAKQKSAMVKRLSSTGHLKRYQPHQKLPVNTNADLDNNSNKSTEIKVMSRTGRPSMNKTKSMTVITPYGLKHIVAADSSIKLNHLEINKNPNIFRTPIKSQTARDFRVKEKDGTPGFCSQLYPPRAESRNSGNGGVEVERSALNAAFSLEFKQVFRDRSSSAVGHRFTGQINSKLNKSASYSGISFSRPSMITAGEMMTGNINKKQVQRLIIISKQ